MNFFDRFPFFRIISPAQVSEVEDYEDLIPTLSLPDADDRQVLAAAIKTEADLILTIKLKDFPRRALAAWNLTAKHPDEFTTDLLRTHQDDVLTVLQEIRARRKRPPISAEAFLAQLERQGLKGFVTALQTLGASL